MNTHSEVECQRGHIEQSKIPRITRRAKSMPADRLLMRTIVPLACRGDVGLGGLARYNYPCRYTLSVKTPRVVPNDRSFTLLSRPISTAVSSADEETRRSFCVAMARLSRAGFLAIAVVFHLVYIYSIFDIYFVSPIVSGMREYRLEVREPPAKRLVLFVGECTHASVRRLRPPGARYSPRICRIMSLY